MSSEYCSLTEFDLAVEKSDTRNPGGWTVIFVGCNNDNCSLKRSFGLRMEYEHEDCLGNIRIEDLVRKEALDSTQNWCRRSMSDAESIAARYN